MPQPSGVYLRNEILVEYSMISVINHIKLKMKKEYDYHNKHNKGI